MNIIAAVIIAFFLPSLSANGPDMKHPIAARKLTDETKMPSSAGERSNFLVITILAIP